MKKKAVMLLLLLIPLTSFCGNKRQYRIVAELAYALLSGEAKNKLQYYLKGLSIEEAGTWSTDIQSDVVYHFLKPYQTNPYTTDNKLDTGRLNIFTGLRSVMHSLDSADALPDHRIEFNLLLLMQLVTDLHKPLFEDDASAGLLLNNPVPALNQQTSLFALWDEAIFTIDSINTKSVLQLYEHYSNTQLALIKKGAPLDWINETRTCYFEATLTANDHDKPTYLQRAGWIVSDQLAKAAIRLASLMEYYLNDCHPGHRGSSISGKPNAFTSSPDTQKILPK